MRTIPISILAIALLSTAGPAAVAATNLITNGNFATGTVGSAPGSPWSVIGTATIATASGNAGVDPFSHTGSPDPPGTRDLAFTAATTSTVTQSVNLVAGTSYWIGLDTALFGTFGHNVSLSVTIGGVALAGLAVTQANWTGVKTWIEKIVNFTAATTGAENLVITETNATTTTKLVTHRVFVEAPEPSSAVLLLGGLAGLWWKRRRERRDLLPNQA